MKRKAKVRIHKIGGASYSIRNPGHLVAWQTQSRVACGRQELKLASPPPGQDVGPGDVGTTGEIKTDKRDFAGTLHRKPARRLQCLDIRAQRRLRT